jgi:ABC-type nitrate/sulfonate/bicarbonate transport system substrate-binding protein
MTRDIKTAAVRAAIILFLALLARPLTASEKVSALYSAQSVSYSLPWIAQDAGLFRKHNLDAQLVYIPSSGIATGALLGGDVEIALAGGVGIVRAYAQAATDLVFIGGFKNALTHSIVTKPDLTQPADLKGKKIGVTRLGSNSHYFAVQALRRMNLDAARDVAIIQAGGEPEIVAALVNGAIDAGSITTPADNRTISEPSTNGRDSIILVLKSKTYKLSKTMWTCWRSTTPNIWLPSQPTWNPSMKS